VYGAHSPYTLAEWPHTWTEWPYTSSAWPFSDRLEPRFNVFFSFFSKHSSSITCPTAALATRPPRSRRLDWHQRARLSARPTVAWAGLLCNAPTSRRSTCKACLRALLYSTACRPPDGLESDHQFHFSSVSERERIIGFGATPPAAVTGDVGQVHIAPSPRLAPAIVRTRLRLGPITRPLASTCELPNQPWPVRASARLFWASLLRLLSRSVDVACLHPRYPSGPRKTNGYSIPKPLFVGPRKQLAIIKLAHRP
jgi:hypothetical protein